MATERGSRQAPPWAQVWLGAAPIAVAPWLILGITRPSAFALNIAGASFFAAVNLLMIWAYLWSPVAQKNPGIVAARVVSSVVGIQGCFALGYYLFSARYHHAFNEVLTRIDAAYFTVSTATTTGMGDIHPVSQAARLVVTAQMVASLFLVVTAVGTALARLLSRAERAVDLPARRSS